MGFRDGLELCHAGMQNIRFYPMVKTWGDHTPTLLETRVFCLYKLTLNIQWLIVLPLEIVAASITIDYWDSNISNAAWVAIFWVMIVVINMFGVKGYGEAEFIFSTIKVIAVLGFM